MLFWKQGCIVPFCGTSTHLEPRSCHGWQN